MKELKPETAGNAPELQDWMRNAADEFTALSVGGELYPTPKAAGRLTEIIAKHYASRVAASSQEAATHLNKTATEAIGDIAANKKFKNSTAEPAPSPATKETPPKISQIGTHGCEVPFPGHYVAGCTWTCECGVIYELSKKGVWESVGSWEELSANEIASRNKAEASARAAEIASSQGPAREETPPMDILSKACAAADKKDYDCSMALGLERRAAFVDGYISALKEDAGAKSVVAAPQNEISLEKRLEIAEESERGGRIRLAGAHKLLKEILDTVNLLPSVCRGSPLDDIAQIPWAIRDLQNCYADAAKARNGLYTKMQERAETAEAQLKTLAGAAALPSRPHLKKIADEIQNICGDSSSLLQEYHAILKVLERNFPALASDSEQF